MWPNLESESAYFQGPFEMIIRTDIERKLFFTSKFSPDKGILVIRHKIKIVEIARRMFIFIYIYICGSMMKLSLSILYIIFGQ